MYTNIQHKKVWGNLALFANALMKFGMLSKLLTTNFIYYYKVCICDKLITILLLGWQEWEDAIVSCC